MYQITFIYFIKLHTYSVIQQKLHISKLNHGIYLSYNLFLKFKQLRESYKELNYTNKLIT